MLLLRSLLLLLIVLEVSVVAEQQANDDAYAAYDDAYAAYDDAAAAQEDDAAVQNNDDAAQSYYYDNVQNDGDYSAGDDAIKYWTNYAILPKRCIV